MRNTAFVDLDALRECLDGIVMGMTWSDGSFVSALELLKLITETAVVAAPSQVPLAWMGPMRYQLSPNEFYEPALKLYPDRMRGWVPLGLLRDPAEDTARLDFVEAHLASWAARVENGVEVGAVRVWALSAADQVSLRDAIDTMRAQLVAGAN